MIEQCWGCELEVLLRERDRELRYALQGMNPNLDQDYEPLFDLLLHVDRDRSILRGPTGEVIPFSPVTPDTGRSHISRKPPWRGWRGWAEI